MSFEGIDGQHPEGFQRPIDGGIGFYDNEGNLTRIQWDPETTTAQKAHWLASSSEGTEQLGDRLNPRDAADSLARQKAVELLREDMTALARRTNPVPESFYAHTRVAELLGAALPGHEQRISNMSHGQAIGTLIGVFSQNTAESLAVHGRIVDQPDVKRARKRLHLGVLLANGYEFADMPTVDPLLVDTSRQALGVARQKLISRLGQQKNTQDILSTIPDVPLSVVQAFSELAEQTPADLDALIANHILQYEGKAIIKARQREQLTLVFPGHVREITRLVHSQVGPLLHGMIVAYKAAHYRNCTTAERPEADRNAAIFVNHFFGVKPKAHKEKPSSRFTSTRQVLGTVEELLVSYSEEDRDALFRWALELGDRQDPETVTLAEDNTETVHEHVLHNIAAVDDVGAVAPVVESDDSEQTDEATNINDEDNSTESESAVDTILTEVLPNPGTADKVGVAATLQEIETWDPEQQLSAAARKVIAELSIGASLQLTEQQRQLLRSLAPIQSAEQKATISTPELVRRRSHFKNLSPRELQGVAAVALRRLASLKGIELDKPE